MQEKKKRGREREREKKIDREKSERADKSERKRDTDRPMNGQNKAAKGRGYAAKRTKEESEP